MATRLSMVSPFSIPVQLSILAASLGFDGIVRMSNVARRDNSSPWPYPRTA